MVKRRGENFNRIKPSTLVKLISEAEPTESIFGLIQETSCDKENDARSTVESLISHSGDSQTSALTCTTEMMGLTADTQVVLLDLREPDEYVACHIKESINFPAPGITQDN